MSKIISYKDKHVLIIDDMADMRSSLRNQIGSLEITSVGVAASIRDALELLKQKRFDVILCDYYLGGSTDGQQFLEYLRTSKIISRATLFIMITAETGYESVITAAECLPDDYLLKPFTAETLRSRFQRLMEKKLRLHTIDQLHDKSAWLEIITACEEIIAVRDKYLVDAMRIKGNALLMAEKFDEAMHFYEQALSLRAMPWAKLGLAKAMKAKGNREQAKQLLSDLINDSPNLLSAYDLLGKIHTESGDDVAAIAILDKASNVAPNSLTRQRSLAHLAERTGDFKRVEQALSNVLKKTKNSPLRDPSDYVKLSGAYLAMNDAAKAINVIEDAKTTFKGTGELRSVSAMEAQVLQKTGKTELANEALDRALSGGSTGISEELAFALAKACLVNDRAATAGDILKHVLQNNPDSDEVKNAVSTIFKNHGGEEAAKELIERSTQEVVNLNNEAVLKAKSGAYAEAAQMLTEAAFRLPNNMQIVANASLSLLADVLMNQMDAIKVKQAKDFAVTIAKTNKEHPKLPEISRFLKKIQTKYQLETPL